jgi:hypothetical protein
MAESTVEIERLVREVLAQLSLAPAPAPPLAASPPAAQVPDGQLVLDSRVVTLGELDNRLANVRQLVIPPGAIVTPAARDELYRRNVTLSFSPAAVGGRTGGLRLVLVAAGGRFDPASLAEAIGQDGIQVERHKLSCLIKATDQLAAEVVRPDTLGSLLTPHVAAALCLANRHPGVRAVHASDIPTTAAAIAAVGANLLVVDPAGTTFFQMKQMLAEFCRGGVRECPEVFKKRLG